MGLRVEPLNIPQIEELDNIKESDLPKKLDWRFIPFEDKDKKYKSYVTSVKNQGSCGSCWAFAMTGALESYVLINEDMPDVDLDLSEQMMLLCSGAGTCSGGFINPSFIKQSGLTLERIFPYVARDIGCYIGVNLKKTSYRIDSFGSVPQDLKKLKAALFKYGPLPTTMLVYEDFIYYNGGIYAHVYGGQISAHAVLLVGYDDERRYFIVKNSWGENWGKDGYFRIAYSEVYSDVNFGVSTVAYACDKVRTKRVKVNSITQEVKPESSPFNVERFAS